MSSRGHKFEQKYKIHYEYDVEFENVEYRTPIKDTRVCSICGQHRLKITYKNAKGKKRSKWERVPPCGWKSVMEALGIDI